MLCRRLCYNMGSNLMMLLLRSVHALRLINYRLRITAYLSNTSKIFVDEGKKTDGTSQYPHLPPKLQVTSILSDHIYINDSPISSPSKPQPQPPSSLYV